jgi:hypothetical protein
MKRALLLLALTACDSDTVERDNVHLADVSFDVPTGWHRADRSRPGLYASEWRPESNNNKESLVVIHSETASLPDPSPAAIGQLLVETQQSFTTQPAKVQPLTTRSGIRGAKTEFDFVPPGQHDHYHRVHAVLIEKSGAVIHVLYTARTPDPSRAAFQQVLNSIREEV